MTELQPISYTDIELESYIPSGWNLAEGASPHWDAKEHAVRVKVIDTCDMDWDLVVPQREIDELGRMEALRRAVDRLYRERFKAFILG